MIEVMKEFLLFGVVEVFIVLLFLKKVGCFDKIKYWHMVLLCPMWFACGFVTIPFGKQILTIITLFLYLSVINKKIKNCGYFKFITFSVLYILCFEVLFNCVIVFLFDIDMSEIYNIEKFIYMIPLRFVCVISIFVYKKIKDRW